MADHRLRTVKRPISPTLRGLLSLMLIGLVLAGCSGDDDPVLDPTPTTTTPRTAEPTETPTQDTTPDADPTAELEAEITAFFEEYIKTSDQSWTSEKDLERRREMFADSCAVCLAGYQIAEDAQANGLRFEGAPGTVLDVNITTVEGEVVSVLVTVDAPAAELIDGNGQVVESFEANTKSQVVYQVARREGGRWVIIRGDVLS